MDTIFALWPSLKDFAGDIDVAYTTAASWKSRGSIPAEYDVELVGAAAARGIDLSYEALALARSKSRRSRQCGKAA